MAARIHRQLLKLPIGVLASAVVHAVLLFGLIFLPGVPQGPGEEPQTARVHSVKEQEPPLPEPPPPPEIQPEEPDPIPEPVLEETPPPEPEAFEDDPDVSLDPEDLLPAHDLKDRLQLRPSRSPIGIGGGQAGRTGRSAPVKPLPKPKPPPPPPPPTSAVPTKRPPPEYPRRAVEREIEGRVILMVEVRPDGSVGEITVKNSSGSTLLDQAAIAAVREWLFRPAYAQGQPVRSIVEVPFNFRLKE
jgi:periplasmic protein TonB